MQPLLRIQLSTPEPIASPNPETPSKLAPLILEMPPPESVSPQPEKKRGMGAKAKARAAFYRDTKNNIRSSAIVVKPHNLFEKNRFRAKHRSRSPENKENSKSKTKVVKIDSDSENRDNPVVNNESEVLLEDVDFDTYIFL